MEGMQKIRIVKKNDPDSLEYEVGDVLTVEGTWYGGVNAKGRSGIPLSLDREEYEEYRQEPQSSAGQEEHASDEKGRKTGRIDSFSYQLGVMDCFCEMVAAGVKRLAMSHPFSDREERDRYREEVKRLCDKYEILFYPEEEALLTALFPKEANRGKPLYLFYGKEETLTEYLALKEEQKRLMEQGLYTREEDERLAREFGRLLSYPEDGICRLIRKTENA
ncbi:MAG TPA: hypothetical protein H9744_11300 [Candidatus Eisenbergiella stercoravium]|nr:hypothetical protein [Candidatus Eisenbergiella stercoravium]